MNIDIELLNNLMALYFALGFIFLILALLVGFAVFVYLGMKINKLDNQNFKKRVKEAMREKD